MARYNRNHKGILGNERGFLNFLVPALVNAAGAAISGRKKEKSRDEALHSADVANQQAQAEMKRLTEQYGTLTPLEQERERLLQGLPAEGTSSIERQRLEELLGRAKKPGEELLSESGPVARMLLESLLTPVSEGPLESFRPELELVRQMVNQASNRRGVLSTNPSGAGDIHLEQLGRAGIDLAVREAQERQRQKEAQMQRQLQLLGVSLGEQAGARGDVSSLLQSLQGLSSSANTRIGNFGLQAAGVGERGNQAQASTIQDIAGLEYGQAATGQNQALGNLANTILPMDKVKTPPVAADPNAVLGGDIDRLLGNRKTSTPLNRLQNLTGGR